MTATLEEPKAATRHMSREQIEDAIGALALQWAESNGEEISTISRTKDGSSVEVFIAKRKVTKEAIFRETERRLRETPNDYIGFDEFLELIEADSSKG